jgi:MraZ protein
MTLLTGDYRNSMDEKGRVSFPSKLRSELTENTLILTQGLDRCLWLFPPDEWQVFSAKLMDSASLFQAQKRLVLRRLIAPAQEVEFDKTGRISVPQSLREYAGLSKDCVILGINKYIEIWDSAEYRTYLDETESSFRAATEEMGDICL